MMEIESNVVNGHENGHDKTILMNGESDNASTNGASSMISPIDQRIKKKGLRRLMKQNSKEASPNGTAVVQATRHFKNTRRPRNGYGRGLPKKGKYDQKGILRCGHVNFVRSLL